jgi:O-acetyl-ADP-ribose deacetylase (regulator of RNase III)
MVEGAKGNLLEADAQALVNTVNTVGVMGKGIALQFRQAFPENYKAYQKACQHGELQVGKMHIFATGKLTNPRYIINFPTKKHWRGKSKIEDVKKGLDALIEVVKKYEISSIAIPPLGCGNGGLDWNEVRPLIEKAFEQVAETHVLLYSPEGAPKADTMKIATKRPNMTAARAALLALFEAYLLPGYQLSMLEVQKLAYFLQIAGEPLKLNFTKEKYGPYAETIHHVLQSMNGHFIKGYGDRTQKAIEQTIDLVPDALEEAEKFLIEQSSETIDRLRHVFCLIEGFEYPHGLELLSTVHWVTQENADAKADMTKALELVHSWNKRKKQQFNQREIEIAWQRLQKHAWL